MFESFFFVSDIQYDDDNNGVWGFLEIVSLTSSLGSDRNLALNSLEWVIINDIFRIDNSWRRIQSGDNPKKNSIFVAYLSAVGRMIVRHKCAGPFCDSIRIRILADVNSLELVVSDHLLRSEKTDHFHCIASRTKDYGKDPAESIFSTLSVLYCQPTCESLGDMTTESLNSILLWKNTVHTFRWWLLKKKHLLRSSFLLARFYRPPSLSSCLPVGQPAHPYTRRFFQMKINMTPRPLQPIKSLSIGKWRHYEIQRVGHDSDGLKEFQSNPEIEILRKPSVVHCFPSVNSWTYSSLNGSIVCAFTCLKFVNKNIKVVRKQCIAVLEGLKFGSQTLPHRQQLRIARDSEKLRGDERPIMTTLQYGLGNVSKSIRPSTTTPASWQSTNLCR